VSRDNARAWGSQQRTARRHAEGHQCDRHPRTVPSWTVDGVFDDPCAMSEGAPRQESRRRRLGRRAPGAAANLSVGTGASHPRQVSGPLPRADRNQSDYVRRLRRLGYFGYWEVSPDDAQRMVESPGTVEPTAHVSGDRLARGARRLCPRRCDRLSPIDSAPNGCETGSEGGSLTTPSEFLVRRPRPSWALEPDGLDDPRELLNLGGCGLGQHSTR
jgi:hypothetical protein